MRLREEISLIALGGGVTGDMTGFVASTYLKDFLIFRYLQAHLAAVDASCGGKKTGVNLQRGKNLVGTFHPPQTVLISMEHLTTQPIKEHTAGLVEAVKMAARWMHLCLQ